MSDSFLPISKPFIGAREKELVLDALDSGWVSSIGKYIDEFETNFARYCGTEYALAVSNGTTGLHLALAAPGVAVWRRSDYSRSDLCRDGERRRLHRRGARPGRHRRRHALY